MEDAKIDSHHIGVSVAESKQYYILIFQLILLKIEAIAYTDTSQVIYSPIAFDINCTLIVRFIAVNVNRRRFTITVL